MKNIIYFAFNKDYLKLFKYSYYSIRRHNPEIEILCIIPKGLEIGKNIQVQKFEQENYDYEYSARYTIASWEKFDEYDNYLYLDCDTLCLGKLEEFFLEIDKEKNKIHAVKENESINKASYHYNFDQRQFIKDTPSFNSGTFGFNKQMKQSFVNFTQFIQENKKKAVFFDQPLFNIYFHDQFLESFSKYVELFERYKPLNTRLVHLLGSLYNSNGKLQIYKRFFRKETRGEILQLLPAISKVGLFNCGETFINQQIKNILENENKVIEIKKDKYNVENEYYDLVYIDSARSIDEVIGIIHKLYNKVKKGGIIASVSGDEKGKKILKDFINRSNLDYYQCFEDDVFFTIKL